MPLDLEYPLALLPAIGFGVMGGFMRFVVLALFGYFAVSGYRKRGDYIVIGLTLVGFLLTGGFCGFVALMITKILAYQEAEVLFVAFGGYAFTVMLNLGMRTVGLDADSLLQMAEEAKKRSSLIPTRPPVVAPPVMNSSGVLE